MYKVYKNPKLLLKDIKNLFESMLPNKCIRYFLHTNFNHEIEESELDDPFVLHGKPLPKQEFHLLQKCIQEFLHLSWNKDNAHEIIEKGGLQTLMEIWKIFDEDNEMKTLICHIITNLSLCYDKLEDFFVTGWIRVISEWTKDTDLKIKVMSSKALANLDRDDPNNFIYDPKIYPLYPQNRMKVKPEADVIFIHGILGLHII